MPGGSGVVNDQMPVAGSSVRSFTGQFGFSAFGNGSGKSPGRHCEGNRPGETAGTPLASAALEKYHSPLTRTRVEVKPGGSW